MKRVQTESRKNEKGFTLVELAIVMIIIGLLITGILKGQEMIANAQVSSTITQIKAIDAATSTFKDMFNAFPGDMANASTRLRNCDANPCNDGNGNGIIGNNVGEAPAAGDEGAYFFNQLATADLLAGIDGQLPGGNVVFGSTLPAAPVGGGFMIGHTSTGVTGFTSTEMRPGHYLVVNGQVADVDGSTGVLLTSQAARIDRKLDDGLSDSGSVVSESAAACRNGSEYAEDDQDQTCAIAVRVQG